MNKEQDDLFELYRTFPDFLDRAWTLLNDISVSLDTHSYLYAALDLRLGIERLLSMILILVSDGKIERNQKSIYRIKDFVFELKKIDENYLLKIDSIVNEVKNRHKLDLPSLDFVKLDNIYGQLGSLLHLNDLRLFNIGEKQELDKIEQMVLRAYNYLDKFRDYHNLVERYLT